MLVLALLFVVIPIVEIYVAVLVGHAIGALNTIGLLLLLSIVGMWLTKHEGLSVISRIRRQLDAGQMPTNELIDGGLVLAGGLLLIVPGFVTDGLGLLLLFPPTRLAARRIAKRRFHGQVTYFGGVPGNGRLDGPDDVIDV
ncbi:MAG: FxsA family protein [Actinomycetota bacterium]|nr:FxsA family protein [Actinomycetota bacterium]